MSVHVMSWVFKHSEETLGRRLVLLVLADHAKEDGTEAWPSVQTIVEQARISERQVQYALRRLEEAGAITKTGRHRGQNQRYGTNVYSVNMKGANTAPLDEPKGAIYDIQRVPYSAPEPSLLQPPLGPTPNGVGRRNPIWDALTEVFGEATTETARSRRGKVCRSLVAAGASPDEIIRRAKSWPRHFDDATLTELALEKHWDVLGRAPLRAGKR